MTFGQSNSIKVNIQNNKNYIDSIYKKYTKNIIKENNLETYLYRSFSQYKCQIYKLSNINKIIIDLFSIIGFLLFFLVIGVYSIFFRNEKQKFNENNKVAVSINKIKKELIPYSISKRYKIFNLEAYGYIIDKEGFDLLRLLIKKFWFEPYFILKSMIKILLYCYLCNKYTPSAIIASSEYSFTSSILTAYLNKKNILHINIMHGEKFYYIRDSFFKFSECWVWNRHYVDLFKKLYAYENQFKIEAPPLYKKMRSCKHTHFNKNNKILKYYWSSETDKKELLYIFNGLEKLRKEGFKIVIRYHPFQKEFFSLLIKSYCNNFVIENPENKNIYNSLLETNYALATYSTVLLEANIMGRIPVINDYGNNILMLKKLDYILVKNRQYITFSELLKEYGCN